MRSLEIPITCCIVATRLYRTSWNRQTFLSVQIKVLFPQMHKTLSLHVQSCSICQKAKPQIRAPKVPVLPAKTCEPCSCWFVDFHAPYKEASDKSRYVLT